MIHLVPEEYLAYCNLDYFLNISVIVFNPDQFYLFVRVYQSPKRDVIDTHLKEGVKIIGGYQLLLHFRCCCGS